MSMPKTTQRAYTLRLKEDESSMEALWKTHEAVNKGAKVFGDWLLTLRGGLEHTLADAKVSEGKSEPDRNPTDEERRHRRILLALSWLSVESETGSPEAFIVARGKERQDTRLRKLLDALETILQKRGVSQEELKGWLNDCSPTLGSAIREDAVWVNRSMAFDEACDGQDIQQGREDARTLLWYLLTEDYLKFSSKEKNKQSISADLEEEETESEYGADDVIASGKGAGQRTRHLFCHVFGKSKGFGKELRSLALRDHWRRYLKPLVETAGIHMSEPKAKSSKNEERSPSELHREMLSKAASRLAQIWTKQKQQELDREERAKAEEKLNALEQDSSYQDALNCLNTFCQERAEATGALERYIISSKAILGWNRVVAAWDELSKNEAIAADDIVDRRKNEVKRLQDEDPDEKFGDVNLFFGLAEKEYEPVWLHNQKADDSILKAYVKGYEARADAVRLKVAAFRHPDPFFHPVFCQFGISRPKIKFGRLGEIDKKRSRELETNETSTRNVEMLLWTGCKTKLVKLSAISKRFDDEIGSKEDVLSDDTSTPVLNVSRQSRLAVAAVAGPNEDAKRRVALVFDERKVKQRKKKNDSADDAADSFEAEDEKIKKPSWNGTLIADRQNLKTIGKMDPAKAERAKKRLPWWLIVSLELQPQGPWCSFAEERNLNQDPKYYPFATENKNRKGHAKLILPRLPGLRVLSVDLGHRYAAACAVWETMTTEQVNKACEAAGHEPPGSTDLFLHLKSDYASQPSSVHELKESKADRMPEVKTKTAIYRRIGPDTLPDGTRHPAPWARLDRQFLIKLQGEEETQVRLATNEEIWNVHQLEAKLGRTVPIIDRLVKAGWGQSGKQRIRLEALRKLGWKPDNDVAEVSDSTDLDEGEVRKPSLSVDKLMSSAVRTMRLALKRHGDRARIAFELTAEYKPMPGNRRYYFFEPKELSANDSQAVRENKYIESIQGTLMLWHGLAFSRGWRDDKARQLWDEHVAKLSGYIAPEEIGEESSVQELKKKLKNIKDKLRDVAKALAQNAALRRALHEVWKNRWENDDAAWRANIKKVKRWLFPQGGKSGDPSIRNVGGLSLSRLETITEFRRRVQVAFFTRLHPDGSKTECTKGFGQRTMNALEHLREQRAKQLASRIVEAALGMGRVKPARDGKTPKRPIARVDAPCHAVVVESLKHYRPDETRTRRENRGLTTWSPLKVNKYLEESCELHGLHLRDVSASYTSRQDSRTAAPGLRCEDVTIDDFLNSPRWRKQIALASEKVSSGKGEAKHEFLLYLDKRVGSLKKALLAGLGTVRIPVRGGELFVSALPNSPAAKGLQADLNAAANIGLRALTDPDWPGKWWYVPCESSTFCPSKEKAAGSAALNAELQLKQPEAVSISDLFSPAGKRKKMDRGGSSQKVNLWRDVSAKPLKPSEPDEWKLSKEYWRNVEQRVVEILRKQFEERLASVIGEPDSIETPF
ncbi:MAG: hypothetical protein Kow00107_04740 [Planctomycetota bacterium]